MLFRFSVTDRMTLLFYSPPNDDATSHLQPIYGILVEELVHWLLTPSRFETNVSQQLTCPLHTTYNLSAPDLAFGDVGADFKMDSGRVVLEKFLGRGAFGSVFAGSIYSDGRENSVLDLAKVMAHKIST